MISKIMCFLVIASCTKYNPQIAFITIDGQKIPCFEIDYTEESNLLCGGTRYDFLHPDITWTNKDAQLKYNIWR